MSDQDAPSELIAAVLTLARGEPKEVVQRYREVLKRLLEPEPGITAVIATVRRFIDGPGGPTPQPASLHHPFLLGDGAE